MFCRPVTRADVARQRGSTPTATEGHRRHSSAMLPANSEKAPTPNSEENRANTRSIPDAELAEFEVKPFPVLAPSPVPVGSGQ
jgi:hypothetical protein